MASESQPGTVLTKVNDYFFPMIEQQLSGKGIAMDPYAKQCVIAALSAIHTAMDTKGVSWQDAQLDRTNITQVLLSVACLKLNAAASPREVYFQIRNVKGPKGPEGGDTWRKQIEMGIEGDGNDAILARFGRGVQQVRQFWLVREQDPFEYPVYNGTEVQPPKWSPTGRGDVVRVVYPIIKADGSTEFYISERDDVARNLLAHINNNLMNETFGIAKSRFDATAQQKREIAVKKAAVLKRAQELGLGALDDPDLQEWISPAWTEYHSREGMLIRKMRNNVVKKIPKDFGNAYVEMTYAENADEADAAMRRETAEKANQQTIDVEPVLKEPDSSDEGDGVGAPQPTASSPPAPSQAQDGRQQTLPIGAGAHSPGF